MPVRGKERKMFKSINKMSIKEVVEERSFLNGYLVCIRYENPIFPILQRRWEECDERIKENKRNEYYRIRKAFLGY